MSLQAQRTIGLLENDSLSFNGYTLWTPNKTTYLIDNCGMLINEWQSNYDPGLSVYLLDNGHLLRTGEVSGSFNGAGKGGIIEEYNWEGDIVWSYNVASSEYHQHHDIEPMPNGNILVIAWERKTSSEARQAGASRNVSYWPEVIFELEKLPDNTARIVWEWHAWDHLIQDHDSTETNYGIVADHPELFNVNYRQPSSGSNGDWLHFNGIFYDSARDEIILSARNFNEIYIIDHSTTTEEAAGHAGGQHGKGGDILYRWGNPQAYDRGSIGDRQLFGQHDAQIIPSGHPFEGMVSVFNNGAGRPGSNFSTVDVIDLPIDDNGYYILNEDSIYGPQQLSWQYKALIPTDFYSNNMAGVHALPNGNFLVCEANKALFFEVTLGGGIVWQYQNPTNSSGPLPQGIQLTGATVKSVFRAHRYAPDYPGLADKDLTPGLPIELDPLPSDCIIYGDPTSSVSSATHQELKVEITTRPDGIELTHPGTGTLLIQLYDISGRMLFSTYSSTERTLIPTYHFNMGMYVLKMARLKSGTSHIEKVFITGH